MAYIEITTPDGVRQAHLDRPRMSIGRLSYNDVALPYSQISRQHAELRLVDGVWWIADLHSTNGLHIGTTRVGEQRLTEGAIVALAPDIHLRFVGIESSDPAAPAAPAAPAQAPAEPSPQQRPWLLDQTAAQAPNRPAMAPASQAPSATAQRGSGAARPSAAYPGGYVAPPASPAPPPARPAPVARPASTPAPRPGSTPAARAFGPRSPFADDEERYIPPGMAAEGGAPQAPPQFGGPLPPYGGFDPASRPDAATTPISRPGYRMANGMTSGITSGGMTIGGAPSGAPSGAPGFADPYQRGASGPAPALLHVCQTCGQLTAPDAVYCQNCHHSIAYDCPNCHLSLLPIQDRCPRCQSPNPASVRRAHRNPGG